MNKNLIGTGVALATPLNSDFSIDWEGLEKLINHTIAGKVDYLVVMGTTGESPVFTWNEMLDILEFVFDKANDRIPIVFGVGGNDTEVVVRKSQDVKRFNLEAVLSVCPYYNKPSQKGIIRHFSMIADASEYPVILYNVPHRTVTNIEASTTLELAKHPNIVATKEASGDLKQAEEIIRNSPNDFLTLSGEDSNVLSMIEIGGNGVISVAANLIPGDFSHMVRLALDHEYKKASEINHKLKNIYDLLSKEGNPTSLKAGLEAISLCERTVKPPLYDASEELFNEFKSLLA